LLRLGLRGFSDGGENRLERIGRVRGRSGRISKLGPVRRAARRLSSARTLAVSTRAGDATGHRARTGRPGRAVLERLIDKFWSERNEHLEMEAVERAFAGREPEQMGK